MTFTTMTTTAATTCGRRGHRQTNIGVVKRRSNQKDWNYLGTVMEQASVSYMAQDQKDSNIIRMIHTFHKGHPHAGQLIIHSVIFHSK